MLLLAWLNELSCFELIGNNESSTLRLLHALDLHLVWLNNGPVKMHFYAVVVDCHVDCCRLFGSSGTCSACAQSIPASELVMRAQTGNVYHLNCFTCVACSNRLVPGDRYSIINGCLICEHDYPKVVKGHTQLPLRPSHKVGWRVGTSYITVLSTFYL